MKKDFIKYCLEPLIKKNSTVINDARLLDKPLAEIGVKNVRKILVLHSSHLESPKDALQAKGSYKYLINNQKKFNAIVTLTEQQKEDLVKLVEDPKNIKVISHSIEPKINANPVKHGKTFVYMGRLDKNKQVDHVIKAFKQVSDSLKDYTLDIYGGGDTMDELKVLIEELGLDSKVQLKGVTKDPEGVFLNKNTTASFLTSQFEGCPLVVMESINAGCPVVAYDLKYGPRDLIQHGKNGLIVEHNNINKLAEAMIEVTSIPTANVHLDKKFYTKQFIKNWENVMSTSLLEKLKLFSM